MAWRGQRTAEQTPRTAEEELRVRNARLERENYLLKMELDLYHRRIIAFAIRNSNDSVLIHDTFDRAVMENPGTHPLFHSDRGIQYTTQVFHDKLAAAGMTQSMSRIGNCIDNGPMEGFWGTLKRERYYGKCFTNRESLVQMIEDYITYYNSRRLQRSLGLLTPLEKYELCLAA